MRPDRLILLRAASMATLLGLVIGVDVVPASGQVPRVDHPKSHAVGVAHFRGTTNFTSAARTTEPSPQVPNLSLDRIRSSEREAEGHELPAPAGAAPIVSAASVTGEPPSLLRDFSGLDASDNEAATGFNFEPPDQGLCVGSGFVLESINVTIRAFRAGGSTLGPPASLNAFYGYPPVQDVDGLFGPALTDPSCLYDPETGRWFHVVLTLEADPGTGDLTGANHLDIAVSQTSDPLGTWNLFSIDAVNDGSNGTVDHDCPGELPDTTGPCLGDYPQIGLDANGFFITTNEYAFPPAERFMGAQLYAMSKADLASGAASVPFEMFESLQVPERNQVGFTLRAANVPGTTWSTLKHGTVFFASGMVGFESGNPSPDYDAITLWALSNTASLASAAPSLKLRHRVINTVPYQIPPAATQRAGDIPLGQCLNQEPICLSAFGPPPTPQGLSIVDSLDGRMLGTWYADGLLWFSLGTAVEVGGQDLAGIVYGAIEPFFEHGKLRGRVEMQDYLAVQGNNLIMPSVSTDASGRGYLAFTLVGPDHFPSAAVARISLGHPAQKVSVVEAGLGPQDGFSGYWIGGPRPRWGDYSYVAVDEQGNVWAAVEYIAQTCSFAEWIGDLSCGGTRGAFANFATRVMELK
jgi:hypothetical protein